MEEIIKNLDVDKKIINNTLLIIKSLSLNIEKVYVTAFKTIIIYVEDEDNFLSLEIAKQSLGYFIEIGGKHYKTVDRIPMEELDNRIEEIKKDFKACNIN